MTISPNSSFDPTTRLLYVNSMDVGGLFRLVKRPEGSEIPYALRARKYEFLWDSKGYPCQKPPWGRLTAIDLNTGDFRWQVLSVPFLNFADGVNTPIFEEFAAGVRAISASPEERRALFGDTDFRTFFRKDWESPEARMFHRDFSRMKVVAFSV